MTELTYVATLDVPVARLGEGLYFCSHEMALYWVDILQPRLFRQDLTNQSIAIQEFDEAICWVNKDINGKIVIGCHSGIFHYSLKSQRKTLLWRNREVKNNVRLNDAKCDRSGRLYFGTMDNSETEAKGRLYTIDNSHSCITVDTEYTVSNGPAFNLSGDIIYSVSSTERTIYKIQYSKQHNTFSKSVFIKWPSSQGYPDGLTVDNQNNLWIASWGGAAVYCYSEQGKLVTKVSVPALYVTNITFAGPQLNDVYITSASHTMTETELTQFPDSGKVFHYKADNVNGVAETAIRYLPKS